MSSVRPVYINVYQRILTANKYTVFNFACLCTSTQGKQYIAWQSALTYDLRN